MRRWRSGLFARHLVLQHRQLLTLFSRKPPSFVALFARERNVAHDQLCGNRPGGLWSRRLRSQALLLLLLLLLLLPLLLHLFATLCVFLCSLLCFAAELLAP